MARNITWLELRTRIRQRTNKEKSLFITDTELNGMIEEAYAEMYNVLVGDNENYFISSSAVSLVAGTSLYNLPDDFFKLKGVDITSGGLTFSLDRIPWENRSHYQGSVIYTSVASPVGYCLYNNQLKFLPTPSASGAVTVYYIPAPPVYVSDVTKLDGISGFETYIIYTVAATIAIKEEKSADLYLQRRDIALKNLRAAVSERDFENPVVINDVIGYDV